MLHTSSEIPPDSSLGSPVLVASGVSKRFGATVAVDGVSVEFRRGEVHALMGENGAGKSTLGRILAGVIPPDTGSVSVNGTVLPPGDLRAAAAAGVRLVHQELAQCPNLSVAENLCLHAMPRSMLGLVDTREMHRRAASLVGQLDASIDVRRPLGDLSLGQRQVCQIAAALDTTGRLGGAKVIVLDEPTSALSHTEAERLLALIRQLRQQGLCLIYVSHRMGEVMSVCDRATVLRDGRFVATTPVASLDEGTLVEQMIGRRLESAPKHARQVSSRVVLEVRGLSSPGRCAEVSFDVRQGETVGLAGLVGAGRSEVLDAVFGLDPQRRGTVLVEGHPLPSGSPRSAIRAGVGYVPEDRRSQGLFFDLGVHENIALPHLSTLSRVPGVRAVGREHSLVSERMSQFQVKAASAATGPGTLSGGNQQKVLLARWMGPQTRLILLDEPTRGIDVGTKQEVHRLIRDAAARGTAVLLVSSEMPELLALADRVLVLAGGRVTGELSGDDLTQANILRLATLDTHALN